MPTDSCPNPQPSSCLPLLPSLPATPCSSPPSRPSEPPHPPCPKVDPQQMYENGVPSSSALKVSGPPPPRPTCNPPKKPVFKYAASSPNLNPPLNPTPNANRQLPQPSAVKLSSSAAISPGHPMLKSSISTFGAAPSSMPQAKKAESSSEGRQDTPNIDDNKTIQSGPATTAVTAQPTGLMKLASMFFNPASPTQSPTAPGPPIPPKANDKAEESVIQPVLVAEDLAVVEGLQISYQPPAITLATTPPVPLNPTQFPQQRDMVAFEMYTSEHRYVRCLELVENFYILPLREPESPFNNLVTPLELKEIFGNIEIIRRTNQQVLHLLEERVKIWSPSATIADIFLKMAPFFKVYSDYFSNYDHAISALQRVTTRKKEFADFIKLTEERSDCNGLTLGSLLISPVQRLPRIVLLLMEIRKMTKTDHGDHKNIETALGLIREITGQMNTNIKTSELAKKFRERKNVAHLIAPHRSLIMEGPVLLQSFRITPLFYTLNKEQKPKTFGHQRSMMLFNDYLCIEGSSYPGESLIAEIDLVCLWIKLGEKNEMHLQTADSLWIISFSNSEDRATWATEISAAIHKSVFPDAVSLPGENLFEKLEQKSRKFNCKFADGAQYEGAFMNAKMHGEGKLFFPLKTVYQGMMVEGYMHGEGELTYFNGDKYKGSWQQGNPHGYGELVTATSVYKGEWRNGKKYGKGELTYVNSGNILSGQWVDDMISGKAKFTSDDGSFYDGAWKDNLRHGEGIYKNALGTYEGFWKSGRRSGQGSMRYTNGSLYSGSWENDLPHGQGMMVMTMGNYQGFFVNGKREGKGILVFDNGDSYDGNWLADKRHGKGTFTDSQGIYEGSWASDAKSGEGNMIFKDGRRLYGKYLDNKIHGSGIMTYFDGSKYEGEFQNDKREGRGTFTTAFGKHYGYWSDDRVWLNPSDSVPRSETPFFLHPRKTDPESIQAWSDMSRKAIGPMAKRMENSRSSVLMESR
eukprot:TRINITY_DN1344_c0_g1_i1.p1 TRINITY_DN1344_c0_g1~~TRINITY_DN1344_c0_g1_i1.p1  ORF type:complete len:974 (-),score=262.23 TRINITY_DN1344_c0_g1_i1:154-3075(-)